MIFQETCGRVLNGTKTQTTRLGPRQYRVGGTYAVQPGRGKRAIGRIQIDWRRECLVVDQLPNYTAEGFEGAAEFLAALRRIYGFGVTGQTAVTVYGFRLL
jgi:hypothetical protein